jgi:hypothetical protein
MLCMTNPAARWGVEAAQYIAPQTYAKEAASPTLCLESTHKLSIAAASTYLTSCTDPCLAILASAQSGSAFLQALLELVAELHACPNVSMLLTSRIKPNSELPMLELPPLDVNSAVSLLRSGCGTKSRALQPQDAVNLVQLCGCNALLSRVLGGCLARSLQLEVRCGRLCSCICLCDELLRIVLEAKCSRRLHALPSGRASGGPGRRPP